MAPVLRAGWEVNDPSVSSTQFKASVPATTVNGTSSRLAYVNDIKTGTFDVYEPNALGQYGSPIASYSPSQNKLIPIDETRFNAYFDQNTTIGKKQYTQIVNGGKLATYDLAQLNTGTDPTLNQNFQNLQKLNGYQSLANSAAPGQRAPGATLENPAGGDPAAAPIDEKTAQENLDKLKISDDPRTRLVSEYPDNLKYPLDMNGKQDCIRFTMLQYAPRQINIAGISQGDPLSERSTTQNRTRGKTVILPIQPTISDNNVVKWGPNEMDAGQLIAASAALGTILEGPQGAINALQAVKDLIGGANQDLKTAFAAGFADAAAGTKGLLTRVTGGIVNPNMELLFEGPDLRTFNFTFSLSAREPKEAKVIRNIIRFFKQGMSVKRASTGLFLKSPHTFEIKYYHAGKEHEWINKIKECALTSCNVNYTPAGNYATYEDGAMTQYDLTLSFSELEPLYDDNYGKGSTTYDSEIGY